MSGFPRFSISTAQRSLCILAVPFFSACALQAPHVTQKESPLSQNAQKTAQLAVFSPPPLVPVLKRKVALGRISNETNYGHSLLRDDQGDPLGKQVTDLMSKSLSESGAYLVFERPDVGRVQAEGRLTDTKLDLIGVDALIIGSLTEFGRKTVGERGFVSASKRQVAFAKIDIRVVDVKTGQVIFATSGAGESSTESASTFGFGSQAAYDGTLNDTAIRLAVSEAVNRLAKAFTTRPWQTFILKSEGSRVFISGGKHQGVLPGMVFSIETQGEKIKSLQTGAEVSLPGRQVARIRVESNFGSSELDEGSVARVISGALGSMKPEQLVVRHEGEI